MNLVTALFSLALLPGIDPPLQEFDGRTTEQILKRAAGEAEAHIHKDKPCKRAFKVLPEFPVKPAPLIRVSTPSNVYFGRTLVYKDDPTKVLIPGNVVEGSSKEFLKKIVIHELVHANQRKWMISWRGMTQVELVANRRASEILAKMIADVCMGVGDLKETMKEIRKLKAELHGSYLETLKLDEPIGIPAEEHGGFLR